MSSLPDERRGEVADVLAAHQRTLDGAGSCRCGEWPPASHDVPWPDHVADALAPMLAGWRQEDEQRGREDNADHGMCYVHGSKALEARLAEAEAKALREFADTRGVNVGDEDDDWWKGYRQAQRECLHDAVEHADRIARDYRQEKADA